MQLPSQVLELVEEFGFLSSDKKKGSSKKTDTVSTLATLYEKARNAVELRADHLVRRAAIERILKRRFLTNKSSKRISQNLVLELSWAKYIDSSLVTTTKQDLIDNIIGKYAGLREAYIEDKNMFNGVTWDTILGVASSEIDEIILPDIKRSAFVKFYYLLARPRVQLANMTEEEIDMLVYIAVERSFHQSEDSVILYHLLKMSGPGFSDKKLFSEKDFKLLIQTISFIQPSLNDSTTAKLQRFFQPMLPPIMLIRDFFFEEQELMETLGDKIFFDKKLKRIINTRYKETGVKVRRAVVRSFIYIFLTKMVFALAIEVPYDMYIAKSLDYVPLIINSLLPPILLVSVAGYFRTPTQENTKKLIDLANNIIYDFDSYSKQGVITTLTKANKRPVLTTVFTIVYLGAFLLTFGLINYVLGLIGFSFVSKIIFVFFVALVTFFAYNIRLSARQYEVVKRKGVLEPITDFFFLPILQAGQVLAGSIAKLNMLAFFFDFILEAPLKTIFELLDEWFKFVSLKKEEIS